MKFGENRKTKFGLRPTAKASREFKQTEEGLASVNTGARCL